MITNAELRLRARTALKNNWAVALLIGLTAVLPSLMVQTIGLLTGGDLQSYLLELTTDVNSVVYQGAPEEVLAAMSAFLRGPGLLTGVLGLLAWLIAPVLALGQTHYQLKLLRRQETAYADVFSHLRYFLKSVGLTLLIALKLLLWALPFIAGEILIFVVMGAAWANASVSTVLTAVTLVGLVGGVGMTVVMVRAMFSYSMASTILADEPEKGVAQCVRESVQMMNGKRMLLFSLEISFIGWYLLCALGSSLAMSLFGFVVGETVNMLAQLVVSVYMGVAQCAFYEEYVKKAPDLLNQAQEGRE